MTTIAFIAIILTLANGIISKWVVDTGKEELPAEGKKVDMWGKIILASIGIISLIIILNIEDIDRIITKWFWMVFIILAVGFQAFIDWKYLKGSKQYIVSLIVLILGVILGYCLL